MRVPIPVSKVQGICLRGSGVWGFVGKRALTGFKDHIPSRDYLYKGAGPLLCRVLEVFRGLGLGVGVSGLGI